MENGLTHLQPRRRESPWLFGLGVTLALIGIAVDRWDGPSWVLFVFVALLAAAGIIREFATRRAEEGDEDATKVANSAKSAASGQFPLMRSVDSEAFGVHRAAIAIDHQLRDVEFNVREALQARRPVLLVGQSMTGKTHLVYHLLKQSYSQWRICIPERGEQAALFRDGRTPSEVILWLDDIEGYLTGDNPFRADWIDRARAQGCIVVATVRAEEYISFQPVRGLMPPQWNVIERFEAVWLHSDRDERQRIAATIPEQSIRDGILRYGIAEYTGGGYLARERYEAGKITNPLGAAIVAAAVDWRRLGLESISKLPLIGLAYSYLDSIEFHGDAEPAADALEWASHPVYGLLRLLEPLNGQWRAFDLLVDLSASSNSLIPDVTWVEAIASVEEPSQLLELGYRASLANRMDDALLVWRRAAPDEPIAAFSLGVLLNDRGDIEGAREAYQLAIDSGHGDAGPVAAANLGLLLAKSAGDVDGARKAYQLAIDSGHALARPTAATSLGRLLGDAGDTDGARKAYQLAIDSGHAYEAPRAAVNLGLLLVDEVGDVDGARQAFQLAIDSGHTDARPKGAVNLGLLLQDAGDTNGARKAYQLAIDSRHADEAPRAAVSLGLLLGEVGDTDGARTAYQLAIDSGHADQAPVAAVNLDLLIKNAQDVAGTQEI